MRIVKVPSWCRDYFTPEQLSGLPRGYTYSGLREFETRETKEERRRRKRRERRQSLKREPTEVPALEPVRVVVGGLT